MTTSIGSNPGARGVGSVTQASTTDDGSAPAGEAPPLHPSPTDSLTNDPATLIAILFTKVEQNRRSQENVSADAEEKLEDTADARRVDAMQKKADANFAAGMASGLSQIGQGACSVGAAVAGASASAKGGSADLAMKKWDAGGQFSAGSGKATEAAFKWGADKADVESTKAENDAKMHKRASEALRKEAEAAGSNEQKVIQLLDEIMKSQAATGLAIASIKA